jgi:cell division protein FtsX
MMLGDVVVAVVVTLSALAVALLGWKVALPAAIAWQRERQAEQRLQRDIEVWLQDAKDRSSRRIYAELQSQVRDRRQRGPQ